MREPSSLNNGNHLTPFSTLSTMMVENTALVHILQALRSTLSSKCISKKLVKRFNFADLFEEFRGGLVALSWV